MTSIAAGAELEAAVAPDRCDSGEDWIEKAWCVFGGLWRRRHNASDSTAIALAEEDSRNFIQEVDRLGAIASKEPLDHENFVSECGELRDALIELIRPRKSLN